MKKFFAASLILFAFACNSGEESKTKMDSTVTDPNSTITNDVPMRTVDTNKNIMKDTTTPNDTITRP